MDVLISCPEVVLCYWYDVLNIIVAVLNWYSGGLVLAKVSL